MNPGEQMWSQYLQATQSTRAMTPKKATLSESTSKISKSTTIKYACRETNIPEHPARTTTWHCSVQGAPGFGPGQDPLQAAGAEQLQPTVPHFHECRPAAPKTDKCAFLQQTLGTWGEEQKFMKRLEAVSFGPHPAAIRADSWLNSGPLLVRAEGAIWDAVGWTRADAYKVSAIQSLWH